MESIARILIRNHEFWLLAERLVYWPEARLLFGSDFHLAKSDIFQKSGIAIPNDVFEYDLQKLRRAIQQTGAQQLLILGDFVHGKTSSENLQLRRFMDELANLGVELKVILGNHDQTSKEVLRLEKMQIIDEYLEVDEFAFAHEPWKTEMPSQKFFFFGHLHPCISLRSRFDRLRLPCFVLEKDRAYLPAFSRFTGGQEFVFEKSRSQKFFAVLPQRVLAVTDEF